MSENEFITGMNNYFFKRIFGSDINRIKKMVELITKEKLNGHLEYENVSLVEGKNSKAIDADIVFSVSDLQEDYKILVDVEPQGYLMGDGLINRQLYYFSLFFSSLYDKGSLYKSKRKVVEIYLHKTGLNNQIPISITKVIRKPEDIEYEVLTIYDVYLKEFEKIDLQSTNKDDKILIELMNLLISKDMDKYERSKTKLIREVANMVKGLNKDQKERISAIKAKDYETRYYDAGYVSGLDAGYASGLDAGANEKQREYIRTMYSNGLSKEDISKYLSLDKASIDEALK